MTIPRITESRFKELFESASLLPAAEKGSFEIDDLTIRIDFDANTRIATWTKAYRLHKIRNGHDGNDWWWEITGCPDGQMEIARGHRPGYGYETFHDERDNLVYWVDLAEDFPIGSKIPLTVCFHTAGLEKEDKLLTMERAIVFRKYLFRNDIGYACPIERLKIDFHVSKGVIVQAWPRTLSSLLSPQNVEFVKPRLRIREIFTPLVQIETGSRLASHTIRFLGVLTLGVAAGLTANYLYSLL